MFTREELEDIWNNKPYGYFKKEYAKIKDMNRFEVTTVAYKLVEVAKETNIVFAKNTKAAIASDYAVKAKMKRDLGENQWTTNLQFSTKATQIY